MRYKLIAIFGDLVSFDRREQILNDVLTFAKHGNVEGDYLEFGVWKGGSLSVAEHLSRHLGMHEMRLFGFDSFEGLPDVTGIDASTGEFSKADYAASEDVVRRNLKDNGVHLERVTLVKGWYDTTLTPALAERHNLRKAAVAYIDCDLYESTVPVLEFLTPLLQDGTVLIFDDWFCYRGNPDLGEQRAFAEWTAKYGIRATPYHTFGWPGYSFIVHRDV